jgi:acyl-CoA dehydrogenase
MSLALTEEQDLLQQTAREFAQSQTPVSQLRELRDNRDPRGYAPRVWKSMAEMGWAGMLVPEPFGGSGLGLAELGVVMEELGRTLAASPMLTSAVVGASFLVLGGSDVQKTHLLPRLATGDCLFALALEEDRHFSPYAIATRAEHAAGGYRLSGSKTFVLDGHVADHLIVAARSAGVPGDRDGISLFLAGRDQPGICIERTSMLDSRNAARVDFEDVVVNESTLLGNAGEGGDLLDSVLDRATGALSAEMLGTMSAAFEITVDYLKVRKQFGVPIGSFQALKHRAAQMYVDIELARSLVRDALRALDEGREDAPQVVSAAKARVSGSLVRVANEAIQLHGGIGMTDEHDIGLYLKRARVAQLTLGDERYHWSRFATLRGF